LQPLEENAAHRHECRCGTLQARATERTEAGAVEKLESKKLRLPVEN
jgi:hypothetical protein